MIYYYQSQHYYPCYSSRQNANGLRSPWYLPFFCIGRSISGSALSSQGPFFHCFLMFGYFFYLFLSLWFASVKSSFGFVTQFNMTLGPSWHGILSWLHSLHCLRTLVARGLWVRPRFRHLWSLSTSYGTYFSALWFICFIPFSCSRTETPSYFSTWEWYRSPQLPSSESMIPHTS